jgi:ribonuclease R
MEAERAMLDLRKADFMLGHLLEPEPATVVSVIGAGLFVELDAYPVEGLVRADDLADDRYYYVETERALKGMRTGQRFRLGDRVVVEATNVSLQRRQIDFALVRRLAAASGDAPGKRAKRPQRAPAKGRGAPRGKGATPGKRSKRGKGRR